MTTQAARNLKLSHGGLVSANGSVAATPSPAASSHRSSISTSHGYFLDSNYANTYNNGYNTSAATSPLSFTFQVPMGTPPSSGLAGTQQKQFGFDAGANGSHPSSLFLGSSIAAPQQQHQHQYQQNGQERLPSTSSPYSYNLQPDNSKTGQGHENPLTFQATGHFYPTECQNFASEQNINRVSLQVQQQEEQKQQQQRIHTTSHLQQDTTTSCGNFKPFKHASLLPTTEFQNATHLGTTQQNSPSQDATRHQNDPQDQHQHHQYHRNHQIQIQPTTYHNHHQILIQNQHQHQHQTHHPHPTSNYYNNSPAAPGTGSGFLQLTPEDQYLEASRAAASSFNITSNYNNNNNIVTPTAAITSATTTTTTTTTTTPSPSSVPKMPLVVQPQPTLSSLLLPPLALNPVFHHHHHHHIPHHHQLHHPAIHQHLPPLPPRQRKMPVAHLKLTRANVAAIDSKDSRQARWHRVLSYVAQVRSSFAQGEISGSNNPTAAWISHQERIVKSSPDDDLIDAMMDPLWATQPVKRQRSLWDGGFLWY